MPGLAACTMSISMCAFGAAPMPLSFLPAPPVMGQTGPFGNITGFAPFLNVKPYAVCISMVNPMVLAATIAAFGILVPMPCIPVTTPWIPTSPMVICGTGPILTNTCPMMCAYCGANQIIMSPTPMVMA